LPFLQLQGIQLQGIQLQGKTAKTAKTAKIAPVIRWRLAMRPRRRL
jgi:hypothetical protein